MNIHFFPLYRFALSPLPFTIFFNYFFYLSGITYGAEDKTMALMQQPETEFREILWSTLTKARSIATK